MEEIEIVEGLILLCKKAFYRFERKSLSPPIVKIETSLPIFTTFEYIYRKYKLEAGAQIFAVFWHYPSFLCYMTKATVFRSPRCSAGPSRMARLCQLNPPLRCPQIVWPLSNGCAYLGEVDHGIYFVAVVGNVLMFASFMLYNWFF